MTIQSLKKQQGVALAVSLIFLVLITIIGVSSMRGTTMNEMMTANVQQKSSTFQVAESVIESVWSVTYILENTPEKLLNPPEENITKSPDDVLFNNMFDVTVYGSNAAIDFEANATIQYCEESHNTTGESKGIGDNDGTTVNHIYSIHGEANLSATNAHADHDQRGFIKRPAVGRTGNCPLADGTVPEETG